MRPDQPQAAIQQEGRQYYPALDGLRGLAILLVVVYHNFGFINYFFFGWLGVDLFFVLSGFLITDILLKTIGREHYLRNFYTRRMLRIFPLYYLTLIIFLLVLPAFHPPVPLDYYTDHQFWLWTYLQNWLYIFKNAGQTETLHHLWSLAVEEQFYLLWPLIILLLRKPGRLLVFMSLLLVSVMVLRLWVWENKIADLAYFNLYTFSRIDGICIGCMVALLQRVNRTLLVRYTPVIVLFFAGVNFIFFFINRHNEFPYLAIAGYTTFAMLFGLLVNETVMGNTRLFNFIFSSGFMKFFGRISYGLYIFHWPIYLLCFQRFTDYFSRSGIGINPQVTAATLSLLLAIGISVLSRQYFESIFLKWKSRF